MTTKIGGPSAARCHMTPPAAVDYLNDQDTQQTLPDNPSTALDTRDIGGENDWSCL